MFHYNEDLEEFRAKIREFAEREIAPNAEKLDREEVFPWENIRRLAKEGLMGATIPKEWGGLGLSYREYAIAIEEVSRACSSTGVIMAVHNSVATYPLYRWGNEGQKKRYLMDLASGRKLGAFALTEPQAGSDASAVRTRAVKKGGKWILNGNKVFITNGNKADVVLVFATTDPKKGRDGMLILIVEKGMDGFTYGTVEEKMGMRGSVAAELVFENVEVPEENVLVPEGEGFKVGLEILDTGRIGIGAQAVGIAQAALDEALKYSKERVQFGKPISRFQAVQWMLAEAQTRIDASRLLVDHAAHLKDSGLPYSRAAAEAKYYASETARVVTNYAVQIHGGYGYLTGYRVERLYRDAKVTEIYEGTTEIQKIVIAHDLLRR